MIDITDEKMIEGEEEEEEEEEVEVEAEEGIGRLIR